MSFKHVAKWLVGLVLLAGCFFYAILLRDVHFSGIPKIGLASAFCMGILVQLGYAQLWKSLLQLGEQRPLSYLNALRQWSFGAVSRYLPGKIWGLATRTTMAKQGGFQFESIVSALTLETLLDLLVSLAFVGLTWTLLDYQAYRIPWMVLFVLSTVLVLPPIFRRLIKIAMRMYTKRILSVSYQLRHLLLFIPAFLTLQIVTWSSTLLLLPHRPGSLRFALAWTASGITGFLGGLMALFVPAGMGVREMALSVLWGTLIPAQDAMAIALVVRALHFVTETTVFIPLLIQWLIRKRKPTKAN